MTAPRIAARRLAALLCISACHTWEPVPLAPDTNFGHDAWVRVELADQRRDSTALSGNGSATAGPRRSSSTSRESLATASGAGKVSGRTARLAIADVRHPEQYRFSGGRTTALVVGVGVVVAVAIALENSMRHMQLLGSCRPTAELFDC